MARKKAGSLLGLGGYLLGLDVGAYGLQAALANVQGEVLRTVQQPLPRGSEASQTVLEALQLARGLLQEEGVRPAQLIRCLLYTSPSPRDS